MHEMRNQFIHAASWDIRDVAMPTRKLSVFDERFGKQTRQSTAAVVFFFFHQSTSFALSWSVAVRLSRSSNRNSLAVSDKMRLWQSVPRLRVYSPHPLQAALHLDCARTCCDVGYGIERPLKF